MRCNASHFCSGCVSRSGRTRHSRHLSLLSEAANGHSIASPEHAVKTPLSWDESHGKLVGRRPVNSQEILVDDLEGTLEAHRARNRAAVVRKVIQPSDTFNPYLRLQVGDLPQGAHQNDRQNNETPASQTPKEKGQSNRNRDKLKQKLGNEHNATFRFSWPADSLQAKQTYKKSTLNKYIRSTKPLEYTGRTLGMSRQWQLRQDVARYLKRPWLHYVRLGGDDNQDRFVSSLISPTSYLRESQTI